MTALSRLLKNLISLPRYLCGTTRQARSCRHSQPAAARTFRPGIEVLEDRLVPSAVLPAAPVLTAQAVSSSQVNLSWHAVTGATGYLVDQWTGSAWKQTASLGSTSTGYAVTGLSGGTTYYFDVGAFNSAGTTWASYQSATTRQVAPAAPSFSLSVISSSQINVSWNAVSGASSYLVNELVNGAWKEIANLGSGSTSYAVTGLGANTTYTFEVGASNSAGTTWAASRSATTLQQTIPPTSVQTTSTWSGYAIQTGSGEVKAVGGTWVQPAVSSTGANSTVSIWVGMDGDGNNTVEQLGTSWSAASGYQAWIEFYGDGVQNARGAWTKTGPYFYQYNINSLIGSNYFNIQPGDTISAEVVYESSTSTTSTFMFCLRDAPVNGTIKSFVQDLTTSYVVPARSTAEWIVESPDGGAYPLANFGTVRFSGAWATIGSTTGPITAWHDTALNLAPQGNRGGGTDTTSGILNSNTPALLEPSGGSSSFTVTFGSAHSNTAANTAVAGARAGDAGSLPAAVNSVLEQSGSDALWAAAGAAESPADFLGRSLFHRGVRGL